MNDNQLPIGQHLLELRNRITKAVAAVLLCTVLAFVFHQQILSILMSPAHQGFGAMSGQKPIYTELTEYIGTAMKVSLLFGLFLALPFVLFQVVKFVAPGLTGRERRYLYVLLPVSLAAFVLGASFGYFVLFPPAVRFLLTFGSDIATPFIRIGKYTSLMLTLLFWMGIVFETPVVLFFLSKIGIVTPAFLSKNRRYAVVIAFVLAAIITPTIDPINQLLVAIPIIFMYELGILLARIGGRGRRAPSQELNLDTDGR